MAVAKGLGARAVIAVDINNDRLAFAKSYCATHTYLPVSLAAAQRPRLIEQPAKPADEDPDAYAARIVAEMLKEFGMPAVGKGAVDLAIEASGAPSCVLMGVHILKPAYVSCVPAVAR